MRKQAIAVVGAMVVGASLLGAVSAQADGGHDRDHDRDHDGDRGRDGGRPQPPPPPPPTTAHGTNFQVKNGLDNGFCMDIAAGVNEGRALSLSTCSAAASQRWAFTWNANDTNSIIEAQGMCVDVRGRRAGDGTAIAAFKCHHGDNQRFTFTPTGHIQELKSGKCLSVPRAAAGVAVFLEDCNEASKNQTWKLAQ